MKQLFGLLLFQIFANNFANVNSELTQNNLNSEPTFTQPIENVSIAMGREAVLSCYVENLQHYKVGWMRAADQTVLALQGRVVTHNSRYSVANEEMRVWRLKINNIRESDRGCYMCQINTTPLKKQIGCIDVNLPPDILDSESSQDITVNEGQNASLYCTATGNPRPRITWRRDDGSSLMLTVNNGALQRSDSFEGDVLNFMKVDRQHLGAYLCIAKNDVPPSVSKRIFLHVNFAPNVTIVNEKSLHVLERSQIEIECVIEASPRPVSYWIKEKPFVRNTQQPFESMRQNVIQGSERISIAEEIKSLHKIVSRLKILNFGESDVGIYSCVASNVMGRANSTLQMFEIKMPTTTTTTTTPKPTTSTRRTTTTLQTTTTRRAIRVTTTTELITDAPSTEIPPYEYITFEPEKFNEISDDTYNNRPHMNIAYSTSDGVKIYSKASSFVSLIFIAITISLPR